MCGVLGKLGLKDLRDRADNVRQIGGDLRLEAFVGRLSQFHGTREDMEGIAGVAANKLPRDWNDGDRERAVVGVAELAALFLKTETSRAGERSQGSAARARRCGRQAEHRRIRYSESSRLRTWIGRMLNDLRRLSIVL